MVDLSAFAAVRTIAYGDVAPPLAAELEPALVIDVAPGKALVEVVLDDGGERFLPPDVGDGLPNDLFALPSVRLAVRGVRGLVHVVPVDERHELIGRVRDEFV